MNCLEMPLKSKKICLVYFIWNLIFRKTKIRQEKFEFSTLVYRCSFCRNYLALAWDKTVLAANACRYLDIQQLLWLICNSAKLWCILPQLVLKIFIETGYYSKNLYFGWSIVIENLNKHFFSNFRAIKIDTLAVKMKQ